MVFEVALAEEGAADSLQTHEVAESGHGRKEVRRCDVLDVTGILLGEEKWAGLHTAVMVTSTRRMTDKETTERRYYISSRQGLSAVDALDATRSHWGIENQCHWVLDVAFDEDQSRVRVGNAGANFAVLRHIALNLLKRSTSRKVGIKNRRLIAAWDNNYLARVLVGQGYKMRLPWELMAFVRAAREAGAPELGTECQRPREGARSRGRAWVPESPILDSSMRAVSRDSRLDVPFGLDSAPRDGGWTQRGLGTLPVGPSARSWGDRFRGSGAYDGGGGTGGRWLYWGNCVLNSPWR
jgi:predicted transposase YbfD/YdcC